MVKFIPAVTAAVLDALEAKYGRIVLVAQELSGFKVIFESDEDVESCGERITVGQLLEQAARDRDI